MSSATPAPRRSYRCYHLLARVLATNYALKVAWETLITPVTDLVVGFLKKAEDEDYYDRDTDFTPFSLSA